MSARLITIPFSHYCEKARWALDGAGIRYQEEGHLPFFSRRATRKHNGTSVPLLITENGTVLTDSTDILRHAGWSLDGDAATLEAQFDDVLGPHARRLAYFHLLKDDQAMRAVVARAKVPAFQRVVGARTLFAFKFLLRQALRITPEGASRSHERVLQVCDDVAARLKEGRRFLTGDRFGAADLTFASLIAPLVIPEAYANTIAPLDVLGSSIGQLVADMRAHPAGAFAVRLYTEERARQPLKTVV